MPDPRGHHQKRYKITRKNPFFPIPPWEKINFGQKKEEKETQIFLRDVGWIRTRSLQNTTLDLPARARAARPRDRTFTGQRSVRPKLHSILMTSSFEGWVFSIQNAILTPLTTTNEK